jgi:hypothetical protein
LVGKLEEKRLVERCRHKWEDIFKWILELGQGGVEQVLLAPDRDTWLL